MPRRLTDNELAAHALDGNENAFAELHTRYQNLVAQMVRGYFQRRDEVEELVQQIFIKVWQGMHHFRGAHAQSFTAWIVQVTRHSCCDELRRRQRNKESVLSQLSVDESSALWEQRPLRHENKIEQTAVSRDLLQKLLTELEPCDRQVFVMLKAEDHSIAEIAATTGWSEAKIKMRIRRSRLLLQRRSRKLI